MTYNLLTYPLAVQRRARILNLKTRGYSRTAIAKRLHITRQRVTQIINTKPQRPILLHPAFANQPAWCRSGCDRIRAIARYRDNYTCQTCKKKWTPNMRRFDVHHLNGLCGKRSRKYETESALKTLITLCHKCHFNHPQHSMKLRKRS